MANHLNSDQQLDQAVKEALESYEVPFESSAWTEMEKSLDAAPKTFHPFKKWSFSLNTIIGIAALAGGLLIFKYSTSEADTSPAKTAETHTPAEEKIQPAPVQPKPEPAVTAEAPAEEAAEETSEQPSQLADLSTSSTVKEKEKKKKKKKDSTATEASSDRGEIDFMKMTENHNNTPAFGDQIDPVKGFIHSTHESDKVKKLAESKLFGEGATTSPDTSSSFRKTKESVTDPDITSDKKKKKDKKKKDSKKDTVPESTTTDSGTKSSSQDDADATAEKTSDTSKVKKNPKQQPKYKGERTIIDP